ncbi:hypothetical protein HK097_005861 [Rhizophlyctis rosea]|uniref:Uncharacterized protein n=1 Tax=Rhizophlyctis rosea TaxID=64517 RepID=A0AAD5SF83_9FUNG|nr:hypothetical protein HK097_005861 [Rhizophlyctis rosea]
MDCYTTADEDEANVLFQNTFYDPDGNPISQMTGLDCEHRVLQNFETPALIQGFNPVNATDVAFRTPTLQAVHYLRWVVHYLKDQDVLKFGFGIENDVQMLKNAGMTGMLGFQRSDDYVIWHQRNVLNIPRHRDVVSMA